MLRAILCLLFLLAPAAAPASEEIRVGGRAPDFSLPDLFGRMISLDYLAGNPGLIVFWSTANPPSAGLLEDCRDYQEQWGRQDLAIVSVNVGGGYAEASAKAAVRDYANRREIVFPVLLDGERATLAAYGVTELPAAVVIDAGGRVSAILRGTAPLFREELRERLLAALGRGAEDGGRSAVAGSGAHSGPPAAGESPVTSCSIPRARSCTRISERDPSDADPAVMAVRLCVCHGDADAAQLMISGIDKQDLLRPDLGFALAHMMLLKGRNADARRAFEALRARFPDEAWGEWGLGLVALAEGDTEAALGHLRTARAGGWSIPEAETAVLKYLEGYWLANRAAPGEEQFLDLFEELDSVRVCYRRLNHRG